MLADVLVPDLLALSREVWLWRAEQQEPPQTGWVGIFLTGQSRRSKAIVTGKVSKGVLLIYTALPGTRTSLCRHGSCHGHTSMNRGVTH